MKTSKKLRIVSLSTSLLALSLIVFATLSGQAFAGSSPTQNGAVGIQGTIPEPPPSRGASISLPSAGSSFTSLPVTVTGICPSGLLIKVFSNNIFVGSTTCTNGNFTVQVNLFSGQNVLTADDYDALGQEGPTTNSVTVTFSSLQYIQYGTELTLSSIYAELGAAPGSSLQWPIIINGGTGPYAVSVDWGDGSAPELLSEPTAGTFNIQHTYQVAGVYKVIIRATDKNGDTAFLQLVGQATGAIQSSSKTSTKSGSSNGGPVVVQQQNLWSSGATVPLILAAFWVGKLYQNHNFEVQKRKFEEAEKAEDDE